MQLRRKAPAVRNDDPTRKSGASPHIICVGCANPHRYTNSLGAAMMAEHTERERERGEPSCQFYPSSEASPHRVEAASSAPTTDQSLCLGSRGASFFARVLRFKKIQTSSFFQATHNIIRGALLSRRGNAYARIRFRVCGGG